MALEEYCAACTYLNETADSYRKYYCRYNGDRYACDPKCYNFCEAYSRSRYARENMYENSRSHLNSGGCYLTTTMCQILNFPDDNYYLQMLRTFRDKVLKQDIKYFPILYTYDKIGPEIAKNLQNDKDKEIIAKSLLNNYIQRAVTAIEEEKNNDAVNIYVAMTVALADRYNINTNIIIPDPSTLDLTHLGHGRIRRRLDETTI